jgi:hypothetical protein|tara:strand:+ start:3286 stop:3453 length:168 start_codon:yes stop_codon:yes gene_type:complete
MEALVRCIGPLGSIHNLFLQIYQIVNAMEYAKIWRGKLSKFVLENVEHDSISSQI